MMVRDERPEDSDAVRAVIRASFGSPAEADLVDRLRADGDAAISLVAEDDGDVVGHVLFSPVASPFRALALAPVSVAPERQRAGIGGTLIRAGLDRARAEGWDGVFVLGDPAYYARFGFDAALAQGFVSPYSGPYLMALALAGSLPMNEGRIRHAPAFGSLSEGNQC